MKNYQTSGFVLKLYISASSNSKVIVSVPRQSWADTFYIPKDSVEVVSMPFNLSATVEEDSTQDRGIHIVSDYPISVSAMNLSAATTDASIVLPLANIPISPTYIIGNPKPSTNLCLLVASQDSTIVQITPASTTVKGYPANTPFKLRLNRGQVYQMASRSDLSGSIVKVLSASKLAVFSGDACSNWPCGACDHQYEQVLPNPVLDTAYCSPPHFGHTKGYVLKIVPLDSSISVTANGKTFNGVSRTRPLIIDVSADSGMYISSTKLFHCFQFMKGAGCNGYITSNYGDPSMLELVSTKQLAESSLFSTVNSASLKDHFVSVVIKTAAKNNVYMDKTRIDSSEFIPFPYKKDYSYACLKISLGQHFLECSDGLLAYCYGLGYAESYLYLAGFNLPNFDLNFKDSVLSYDCKNQTILMQFRAKSDKKLKKYTWYFGDNTSTTGDPVQHLYTATGTYDVKLVGEDFSGKKDSITRKVIVDWPKFDPVRNKIICGLDTVVFEELNPFFTNFKWHDSTTTNRFRSWKNENIWVHATDTTGYCKFVDSGVVGKIDIFSNITVDSIETCWKYNRFKFKDNTNIVSDQILHKAWVFPWKTDWDVSESLTHFPMPGKYKVYFDVYTTQANCKARYPIDVMVYPMPKVYARIKGETFCSEKPILFYDSSQIVTGTIQKAKWVFDDNTTAISDSLRTYKSFSYDPNDPKIIRYYDHIAISDKGCRDTILNAAMVWPKPIVNFTLTTTDTIKCLPSARWTFTSTTKVGQDTFSLVWDAGNGQKSTDAFMKNIRYTKPGKYQVKLKAISPFDCHDSISKTIEVIPVPKAGFTINDTMQCLIGHSFDFRDTTSGKYLKHAWSLGNGYKDTVASPDSVKYISAGIHFVKLKVSTNYPGCEDSITRTIRILKHPVASLQSNRDTQCLSGNQFNMKNTSTFYQPYSTAHWSGKNVNDTNFNPASFSLNDTGNYVYQLVVKDKEGCTDTTSTTVRIIAQAKAMLNINDSIQCFSNNRFVFRAVDSSGNTYDWKLDNKLVYSGKQDSLVHVATVPGYHNIRIISINKGGCSDSTSFSFRLLAKPVTNFVINNDSQCFNGHSFDFTDASQSAKDPVNSWKFIIDTSSYTQATVNDLSFPKDGVRKATLHIKTAEGCIDSISKTFTIFPDPDGFILGDSICLDEIANLKTIQTAGNAINQWDWDLGDGDKANTANVQHAYKALQRYDVSVKITDIHGCSKSLSLLNAVKVYPIPDPAFTYVETMFGINQAHVAFKPVQKPAHRYFWRFPDGSIQSTDTPVMTVNNLLKGTVRLKVTNEYGCTDSSSQDIYIFPNNFNVYMPNAITVNGDNLNDVFRLEGLGEAIDFKLQVMNRWGEEIFQSNDPKKGWDGYYQGSPVPDGVYMYYTSFKYLDGKQYIFSGTITVLN